METEKKYLHKKIETENKMSHVIASETPLFKLLN